MLVELWMTNQVVTLSTSQSIAEAEHLLELKNLRRIPVVDRGRIAGIVCDTDIDKAKPSVLDPEDEVVLQERFASLPVTEVMTENPVTVSPDAPIEEAVVKMRMHKINSIPVVQDGILKGIITETNIFNAFLKILGSGDDGARIEMLIEHGITPFHSMLEQFKQHGMEILTIAVYPDFSTENKMVTIWTRGADLNGLLDGLWHNGVKINKVLTNDDNKA